MVAELRRVPRVVLPIARSAVSTQRQCGAAAAAATTTATTAAAAATAVAIDELRPHLRLVAPVAIPLTLGMWVAHAQQPYTLAASRERLAHVEDRVSVAADEAHLLQ
eukprot:4732481-Prymnesium_polylepis.1